MSTPKAIDKTSTKSATKPVAKSATKPVDSNPAAGSVVTTDSAREANCTNASLVCGIVGLCTAWIPLIGTALSATGLALGLIVGKNEQGKPRTGTIVSGVALGLSILVLLLYIVLAIVVAFVATNSVYDYYQDNRDVFNDWVYSEEFYPSRI